MLKKYFGEIMLFIVTLIGASGWFLSKYSMQELPPMGFLGLRFSLAFILFLPLSYSQLRSLDKLQLVRAGTVGVAYTVNIVLWLLGLINSVHLGEGAFLVSLAMLIAPLLSWVLFKHKPQKLFWISLPIAVAGLYLLSTEKSAFHFSLGNFIFLCSSLFAALYFVLNSHFARNIPVLSLTTIQLGVVGVCCGIYSCAVENWPSTISAGVWWWFGGSVVLATNIRVLLQTIGQKNCNIGSAAIIMVLEPVWTLFLSVLILGEVLTGQKLLGCLLILSALVIYRLQNLLLRK
ncbi:MAG TPA: EamA family transporter [Pasteurellaceae bacterium]|nr:EamA family transporter [Pasteurellaceae bacterium]